MTDQEKEKWNSYLWLSDDNNRYILKNIIGENKRGTRNIEELKSAESTITMKKAVDLIQESLDDKVVDKDRLNAIHRYLFEDIYPFAGEYRKVNMRKVDGVGAFETIDDQSDIDDKLNELFKKINEMEKECHDVTDFSGILAKLYTSLIYIHPYREGNGRTIREFLREYSLKKSEELGLGQLELDWEKVDRKDLDEFIDVVHLFPDSISDLFMSALVSRDKTKMGNSR